ncbi:MAG: NAD-dependent epimerase/dehydratase family protein [Solirubrobacterales bacterium]
MKTLVTGAGGFIGGHLVNELLQRGDEVSAVDCKPLADWYQVHPGARSSVADLALRDEAVSATAGVDRVFNLAADMGGIGFIEGNKAECMLSVLINTHLLIGCRENEVPRYFYSSSACAYPVDSQDTPEALPLKESDAYPAMPEDGYGWEKLFSERMCRHFMEDLGIETRVARYHNVYGPHGAFEGGREKAPAAICRKVAEAALSGAGEIEIWGDGEQTRSFMYIDDCVHGTLAIMESDFREPLNLGSDESVTINQLVGLAEGFADVELLRNYDLSAPQGVRGRNSDNALISEVLGWAPGIPLEQGLGSTYAWIEAELAERR